MTDAADSRLTPPPERPAHDVTALRLLPWAGPEGNPAALVGDGGALSRRADELDALFISTARTLWGVTQAVVDNPKAPPLELRFAAELLHEYLGHLLRIASSSGRQLHTPTDLSAPLHVKRWPYEPSCVRHARRDLRLVLRAWGVPELAERAELVLSELLANAIRYADAPDESEIETRYVRLPEGVRIEVHDVDSSPPLLLEPAADAERGRGLTLVDALTRGSWGASQRDGVGKAVWAVLTLDGEPDAANKPAEVAV
jgi:anti-sigma regulatory factor (Ser/Thr protein kinase)